MSRRDDEESLTACREQLNRADIQAAIAANGLGATDIGKELARLATESPKDDVRLGALREVRAWLKDTDEAARERVPNTLNQTVILSPDAQRLAEAVRDLEPAKRREVLAAAGLLGPGAPTPEG